MVQIPDEIMKIINEPTTAKILGTKDSRGSVHLIHVGSLIAPAPDTLAVGAVLMQKTSNNLQEMKKKNETASILLVSGMKSYEIKARVKDFLTSGQLVNAMNERLAKMNLSARGVWTLEPIEIWNQSASQEAGKRIV
ncbi:MAG: hypothetical protein QHH00_00705 [Methanomassiliicoccales archaeon]|jgi:hypothetical protein|nr:hypothetical protein [Methanomassiliicoccales archaeon]